MKRSLAARVALLTTGALTAISLSACDPKTKPSDAAAKAPAVAEAGVGAPTAADHPVKTGTPPEPSAADGVVSVANAPDFAAVYPGGQVEGSPTTADGPSGPGGLVTFTTEAKPDAIIAFYRQKAEKAGLAQVMSLNRGDTVAYGAAEPAKGAMVQVVATGAEQAPTSVQLTWSAGQ